MARTRPTFLLCRPTFYGIDYEINPWMDLRRQADRCVALEQWTALRRTLESEFGATVHTCRARRGLPDICFTANAGLVRGRTFIPSRFRYRERAGEEPIFLRWFRRHGYRIRLLPDGSRFEGQGDALFVGRTLFAGFHFRTDLTTHELLGRWLGVRVLSLELVDPTFYHLDTCFAPLGAHSAVYYPEAFDRYGRTVLDRNVPDLLAVTDREAHQFACNGIFLGRKAVIPEPCARLAAALQKRGYRVFRLPFSEFLKAGGAAKCLALRLQ